MVDPFIMARFLFFLAFLMLVSIIVLALLDYVNYAPAPDKPFAFSTVAELWLAWDKQGYMEYRNQYIGKTELWETEALPYLNLQPVVLLVGPAIGMLILAICVWLLAPGGRERRYTAHHKSAFSRGRASESEHRINYRRK